LLLARTRFWLRWNWSALAEYRFNTRAAHYLLCRACGPKSFDQPCLHPDGSRVNARRRLNGTVIAMGVTPFDGERWEPQAGTLVLLDGHHRSGVAGGVRPFAAAVRRNGRTRGLASRTAGAIYALDRPAVCADAVAAAVNESRSPGLPGRQDAEDMGGRDVPVYDYFCDDNGRTVAVRHGIDIELTTWGEVCYAAQVPMGETDFLAPVRKVLHAPAIVVAVGNAQLRNAGFTRLVKRGDGVYENVTRSDGEARYMRAGERATLPHLHDKISD
jgi:predicted nucleic acid-binding Zn ribbon protein